MKPKHHIIGSLQSAAKLILFLVLSVSTAFGQSAFQQDQVRKDTLKQLTGKWEISPTPISKTRIYEITADGNVKWDRKDDTGVHSMDPTMKPKYVGRLAYKGDGVFILDFDIRARGIQQITVLGPESIRVEFFNDKKDMSTPLRVSEGTKLK